MTGRAAGSPADAPLTRVRRLPELAVADAAVLDEILAAGRLAHVGIFADGWPYVLPIAYAHWRDGLLLHGSTGSRLFRALAAGAPACATITHLDGLVLARSAFNSSMAYRSAMVFGHCRELRGDERAEAMPVLVDHLLPGRWAQARQPSRKEDAATTLLHLGIDDWSVKVGPAAVSDEPADVADLAGVWAGVVPIERRFGIPVPDPSAAHLAPPAGIDDWPV
jgi:nitroimidazol reductase NimA-like FMN-containing flavoprotein (pyridoxamine 5'-phosphate oxidase superfamily)